MNKEWEKVCSLFLGKGWEFVRFRVKKYDKIKGIKNARRLFNYGLGDFRRNSYNN